MSFFNIFALEMKKKNVYFWGINGNIFCRENDKIIALF
jgi:hypothetical protein